MRKVADFVFSRWVRTFLGALVLALLIWFFAPLVAIGEWRPLEGETSRLIAIGVVFALWLVWNLLQSLRAAKRDKQLVAAVTAAEPDPSATASAEEVALLSDKLRDALAALRKTKLGGGGLYQLPWYLVVGPPGAGKTTALVNSGLQFPLAEKGAIKGVGGTRHCDWWFTEEAVLIDTAGRYTTQDSDAAVDAAAWTGFLGLLKKYRPRQPISGALVALSLSDLAVLDDAGRAAHARAIKRRIRELHDAFGARFPIYVLFTKADLIPGFVEFYDALGKEEREQVWGMTFALDRGDLEGGAVAQFRPEFDLLIDRLNDRALERMHQEPDAGRRALIYGFPQQFASLRETAGEFLDEIFAPSRLETRAMLRGVYFTSGTQDGTPIDRLLGAMAGRFGLPRQAVTAFSGQGRSYFLTRLLREVVFGEAGIAELDPKLEKRRRLTYAAAYGGAAIVLLAGIGLWTLSYVNNVALMTETATALDQYETELAALQRNPGTATDLTALLPPLATLRALPGGYQAQREQIDVPLLRTFGLYQGRKLGAQAEAGYQRGLDHLLLPRLLARLEGDIQRHMRAPELLHQALKAYLILGRRGPLDRDLLTAWIEADIETNVAGEAEASALKQHVAALLDRPVLELPLNWPLVEQARDVLRGQPLALRSYQRILTSQAARELPEWRIADQAGPAAARVFTLRSGKPLTGGVDGLYTWAGYRFVFLPALPLITQDLAEDAWVMGKREGIAAADPRQLLLLRRDVLSLYLDDYIRRWDALLADIQMRPFANMGEGLDVLNTLSGPASPFRNLLQAIAREVTLTRADDAEAAGDRVATEAGRRAPREIQRQLALTGRQKELVQVLEQAFRASDPGRRDPAQRVDDHFKRLRDFVGTPARPGEMENVIQRMSQLYGSFSQMAGGGGAALLGAAAGGGGAAGGGSLPQQLATLARTLPGPIDAMVAAISQSSDKVTTAGARQQLQDAWKSNVVPLCQAALTNRYPFAASAAADVPVDDFTRLLGPNGLVDQFFAQNLKPFVDTAQRPWRWQAGGSATLGLSADSLGHFQRAAEIRDGLFAGGQQMVVKFELVPVTLDPTVAQVSLDLDGQNFSYAHGPIQPTRLQWPGPGGRNQVRLTFTPASGSATVTERSGPWAFYRLLDTGRVTPSGMPDRLQVAFGGAGGTATFQLTASSVMNPFTLTALRQFRCPASL